MTPPRLYSDLTWIWPLLSPPEDYEVEAPVLVENLLASGMPEGGTLLHMGCGGGSIDWHLKKHFRLTGFDISEQMLAHARTVNPEVEYVPGDIRTARLARTFDGVFIHDAIAYITTFEDLVRTYQSAGAHLERGGIVMSIPEQVREEYVEDRVRSQVHRSGDLSVTTVEVAFDPDPNDTSFETTFVFLARRSGKLKVEVDTHLNGIHSIVSFIEAMEAASFEVQLKRVALGDEEEYSQYPLLIGTKR